MRAMAAFSPQPNMLPGGRARLSLRFWAAIGVAGVGAGVCGGLLMRLLEAVRHLAWHYAAGNVLPAVQQAGAGSRRCTTGRGDEGWSATLAFAPALSLRERAAQPRDMRLALPPAAAVLVETERSATSMASG